LSLLDPLIGRNPRATLLRIAILVSVSLLVFGWILVPLRLAGISMLPTYRDGAFNFANRAAYWIGEPARGDVVAIRMAGPHAFYVKRIVGMPGEFFVVGDNRSMKIENHDLGRVSRRRIVGRLLF
jgi:signal peptidase I